MFAIVSNLSDAYQTHRLDANQTHLLDANQNHLLDTDGWNGQSIQSSIDKTLNVSKMGGSDFLRLKDVPIN